MFMLQPSSDKEVGESQWEDTSVGLDGSGILRLGPCAMLTQAECGYHWSVSSIEEEGTTILSPQRGGAGFPSRNVRVSCFIRQLMLTFRLRSDSIR